MIWPPLLLADPSPCLRYLVLRDLLHRPADDAELCELTLLREQDPLLADLLALQDADGSWPAGVLAIGRAGGSRTQMTALALARLGYLGFDGSFPPVARAAEFLFGQQSADGSWPLGEDVALTDGVGEMPVRERYTIIPLQTAFPLRGLAMCGFAGDARAERAYDWLLVQRLEDGAWPTGLAAGGVLGYVGGYRRLPHSRWGCRSNTTGALLCLAAHPQRRTSEAAHKALDHLLGRETRDAYALGHEVARMVGAEKPRGFFTYFARFDLALLLGLCGQVGASKDDQRVADLLAFLLGLPSEFGLWTYPPYPQVSHWLTFDLLRSMDLLQAGDWVGEEPRTPFQPYPKRERRY
ncbi:MAG: hypothetical protein ACOYYS_23460 [Chloroflexota bacterium]